MRTARSKLYLLILLLGLPAIGAVVVTIVRAVPWLKMPDEAVASIEKRWAEVEKWGAPAPAAIGDDSELNSAVVDKDVQASIKESSENGSWRIDSAHLPQSAVDALAKLIAWHKGNGGLGNQNCSLSVGLPRLHLIALRLFELALLSATDDPEQEQVVAALHLAQTLRASRELPDVALGFKSASLAVDWARGRGLKPGQAWSRYRPRAEEVFFALARETTCMEQTQNELLALSRKMLLGGPVFTKRDPSEPAEARPPLGLVREYRELVMNRQFIANQLQRAYPERHDLSKLALAMTPPPLNELPKCALVRSRKGEVSPIVAAKQIGRFAKIIEAYDQLIAASSTVKIQR